ncbi:MAG TPA: AzlD domain-containing protein [Xanthobacteraceae bacterium]|nr:AzlD domain-containing protein [Xanthobacteraceae bacterium]
MSLPDALLIVAAMAVVTLATRLGGVWVMGFMPLSSRTESFLRYLAGSVFVALVVPAVARGGAAALVAAAAAVTAMLLTRKSLPSMAVGVAAAALFRAFVQGGP